VLQTDKTVRLRDIPHQSSLRIAWIAASACATRSGAIFVVGIPALARLRLQFSLFRFENFGIASFPRTCGTMLVGGR
jgi:hypothetical protein